MVVSRGRMIVGMVLMSTLILPLVGCQKATSAQVATESASVAAQSQSGADPAASMIGTSSASSDVSADSSATSTGATPVKSVATLPATWPRDVPVPAGKIMGGGSSSEGAARVDFITVNAASSPVSIVAKYRQQLLNKGWLGPTVTEKLLGLNP